MEGKAKTMPYGTSNLENMRKLYGYCVDNK